MIWAKYEILFHEENMNQPIQNRIPLSEYEEIIEWGDTQSKILNLALLRKVDKVVLKKQDNQYFEELVKKLKSEKVDVEVI